MAFLEDVTKGGLTTALVGVGVAPAAPTVLPAVGSTLRPLAKVLIKAGVVAYDAVAEGLAEAGEQVNDLIVEVRAPKWARVLLKPGPRLAPRRLRCPGKIGTWNGCPRTEKKQ